MPTVFLSYSREDRGFAARVVTALEAHGISVWWDALLEGGERFSEATEHALDGADVVVVLWSKTAVKSHWVHDEAGRGRDRGRLVPATIDGTAPPLGFGQFQALDLAHWKGKAEAVELASLVRAIGLAADHGETAPPLRTITSSTGPDRRRLLIGGGVALAAAGAGIGLWQAGWQGGPARSENSVAVLPFRNLSGDPGQDYFGEGIAEEVRNTLARNPLLKVIATTSSNMFRKRAEALPDIAARLDVRHILDGSVRRDGTNVRIAVQLIDGKGGATMWAETFNRTFDGILGIQSEIAQTVLRVLDFQVSGGGVESASRRLGGTTNPLAFEAFLQGRAGFEQFDEVGLREGAKHYARARSIDPQYAAAYAGEARCRMNLAIVRKQRLEALDIARRGYALAPDAPATLAALCSSLSDCLRVDEARPYYDKAFKIAPNQLDIPVVYALHMARIAELDLARRLMASVTARDPLNHRVWLGDALLNYWSGHFDAALEIAEKIEQKMPGMLTRGSPNDLFVLANVALNRIDRARAWAIKAEHPLVRSWGLALVSVCAGDSRPAASWLESNKPDGKTIQAGEFGRTVLLTQIGQLDAAVQEMYQAYRQMDGYLIRLKVDPMFFPLRGHRGFETLLKKMGLSV